LIPGEPAQDAGAEGDGGIERAAGDAADGERAGCDGEADREAEVRIAFPGPGGGDAEDDIGEGEGEQQLDE
jgi:hypothetical protein